jgi:hypothetical protein
VADVSAPRPHLRRHRFITDACWCVCTRGLAGAQCRAQATTDLHCRRRAQRNGSSQPPPGAACALKQACVRMQVTRTGTRRQMHTRAAPACIARAVSGCTSGWLQCCGREHGMPRLPRRGPTATVRAAASAQAAVRSRLRTPAWVHGGFSWVGVERRGFTEGVRAVGRHRAVRGMLSLRRRARRAAHSLRWSLSVIFGAAALSAFKHCRQTCANSANGSAAGRVCVSHTAECSRWL